LRFDERAEHTLRLGSDKDLARDHIFIRTDMHARWIPHSFPPDFFAAPKSSRRLHLPPQIEERLMFLAVVGEDPLLGVMVVIEHGQDHALHVAIVGRCQIRGIDELPVAQ
jgi:hypothetical protein